MGLTFENRKRIKNVRWLLFGVILAQFATGLVMSAVMSFTSVKIHSYIQIGIVELVSFIVPIAVYGHSGWKKTELSNKRELRLNNFAGSYAVMICLMAIGGQFLMMLLDLPATFIFQAFSKAPVEDTVKIAGSFGELMLGMILVGIIPAILEEFWMRGLVFSVFDRESTKAAICFTTVMFALLHARPTEVVGIFFLGFMTSYVMLKTNSLYAAILYHAANNITALIFGYFLPYIAASMWIWGLFTIGILVFAVMIVMFKKSTGKIFINGRGQSTLFIRSFLSIPVLLCFAILIAKIFI